ncbi:MAG: DUF5996 family protein [Candidatus Andeanibacterium colombiense]|uniref:DUF5996 family protein n=1 Tax=Candidatus Andeanibacterium colombiense TaxID=3121345 RepID=A0AAJ5X941_9SPHN|nr:MAG: DUF5996 family protein [Sphingomonadaceae bacterium]
MTNNADWPAIPFEAWKDTCAALHLFTQIVGKYRLAHTPWVNHSWHATLYVNAEGLSTGLIPDGPGVTVLLDLQRQRVVLSSADGKSAGFALEPMSVAGFDGKFREMIAEVGGTPRYNGSPNELPDALPFAEDTAERPWNADAVARFHRALVRIDRVFSEFRTAFLGKVSPVHLFWGSFDLAVTRFSGRAAPLHPGGIPNLPDRVTREAYSHEVSSAGFWPGGSGIEEPCFYSYAYPAPEGFADQAVQPDAARFDRALGEFVLTYEAVRSSPDPRQTLLEFLQSTFENAATLADWDDGLTCAIGRKGIPRRVG